MFILKIACCLILAASISTSLALDKDESTKEARIRAYKPDSQPWNILSAREIAFRKAIRAAQKAQELARKEQASKAALEQKRIKEDTRDMMLAGRSARSMKSASDKENTTRTSKGYKVKC